MHVGRGERIRTSDPLLPKQLRYQAALHPEQARFYRGPMCRPGCEPSSTRRGRHHDDAVFVGHQPFAQVHPHALDLDRHVHHAGMALVGRHRQQAERTNADLAARHLFRRRAPRRESPRRPSRFSRPPRPGCRPAARVAASRRRRRPARGHRPPTAPPRAPTCCLPGIATWPRCRGTGCARRNRETPAAARENARPGRCGARRTSRRWTMGSLRWRLQARFGAIIGGGRARAALWRQGTMTRRRWVRIGCAIALSWQAAVMAQPRVLEPGVEWLPGQLCDRHAAGRQQRTDRSARWLDRRRHGRSPAHAQALLDRIRASGKPLRAIVNTPLAPRPHRRQPRVANGVPAGARARQRRHRCGALRLSGRLPAPVARPVGQAPDRRCAAHGLRNAMSTPSTMSPHRRPSVVIGERDTIECGRSRPEHRRATSGRARPVTCGSTNRASQVLAAGDLVTLPAPLFDTACPEGWATRRCKLRLDDPLSLAGARPRRAAESRPVRDLPRVVRPAAALRGVRCAEAAVHRRLAARRGLACSRATSSRWRARCCRTTSTTACAHRARAQCQP